MGFTDLHNFQSAYKRKHITLQISDLLKIHVQEAYSKGPSLFFVSGYEQSEPVLQFSKNYENETGMEKSCRRLILLQSSLTVCYQ
jgi:hypothetical protein